MNEFPYYIICQKCINPPNIEIKDNETILLSRDKCNIHVNEKIENIVNYKSKWVSNAIKFCQGEHEERKPSTIYCKIHNLFLCKVCFENHEQKHDFILNQEYKENMIYVNFSIANGNYFSLNVFDGIPINEIFKLFVKKFDIPKNDIDKIIFLYKASKIDCQSKKSLKEIGINNNSTIIVIDQENILSEYFEVYNMQKDKCIIHNNRANLFFNQCKMEICEKCLNKHSNHSIENLQIKNGYFKNDFEEYETFIMNSENNKKNILKKVKEDIDLSEKYKIQNNDLNEEINLLKKFSILSQELLFSK